MPVRVDEAIGVVATGTTTGMSWFGYLSAVVPVLVGIATLILVLLRIQTERIKQRQLKTGEEK